MIRISKSETADTRTCDWTKVTMDQLKKSSSRHIADVDKGLRFFRHMLMHAGTLHDHDKISHLDHFHADFTTGFAETGWWDNHRKVNRHHLLQEDGVREDVNLVDVLEFITDCVMAGMARSGSVYPLEIKPELLVKAFQNTVEILKSQVEVVEAGDE